MTDLKLRTARDSDREAIRAVTLAAYQEYGAASAAYWEGYRQNILKTLDDTAMDEWIVAEYQDRSSIIGSVLLCPAGSLRTTGSGGTAPRRWPEIRLLGVTPAWRGQGIGRSLTEECICRVRGAGGDAITLHTSDLMKAAMGLYERMGFERFPEEDFRPTPDLLVKGYRLLLAPAG